MWSNLHTATVKVYPSVHSFTRCEVSTQCSQQVSAMLNPRSALFAKQGEKSTRSAPSGQQQLRRGGGEEEEGRAIIKNYY